MQHEVIAQIKAAIEALEARKLASNKAFDLDLNDLRTALRVIQGIEPSKALQPTTPSYLATKANGITNKDAIMKSLLEFGPLSTVDLLAKVNEFKKTPTTLGTVRVTSWELKTQGKIGYDGKNWRIKQTERQPN